MPKSRKDRIRATLQESGFDQRYMDKIPFTISLSKEPLGDIATTESQLRADFERQHPELTRQWVQVMTLYGAIVESRAALRDSSELRAGLEQLGVKGFADARSAQLLVERGYTLSSIGPLRGAAEAADLMQYFLLDPAEAGAWLAENPKFENLTEIRRKLPTNPAPFYQFAGAVVHPNPRYMAPMLSAQAGSLDTHHDLVPGPMRNRFAEVFSGAALFQALRVLACLHDHCPGIVSQVWKDQMRATIEANNESGAVVRAREAELLALRLMFVDAEGSETDPQRSSQ